LENGLPGEPDIGKSNDLLFQGIRIRDEASTSFLCGIIFPKTSMAIPGLTEHSKKRTMSERRFLKGRNWNDFLDIGEGFGYDRYY